MIWRMFVLLLLLSACGNTPQQDSTVSVLTDRIGLTQAAVSPRFAAVLQTDPPILQVSFVDIERTGNLVLERRDGQFEYWLSPDGAHLILQAGMLHSTRGFGEGLLASDLSEPLNLVTRRQAGVADRFHTYLDGNDRTVTRTYRCVIENDGPQEVSLSNGQVNAVIMTESCRSLDQEFRNFYWVRASTGKIVQSRQWVGPVIGSVSTRSVPR